MVMDVEAFFFCVAIPRSKKAAQRKTMWQKSEMVMQRKASNFKFRLTLFTYLQ